MHARDRSAWMAKNERMNADRLLKVGDSVIDPYGHTGIVVQITPVEPPTEDNPEGYHGTVSVWQDARTGHGLDNCEHYPTASWKRLLRLRTPPSTPTHKEPDRDA